VRDARAIADHLAIPLDQQRLERELLVSSPSEERREASGTPQPASGGLGGTAMEEVRGLSASS
jgi:hypothetical protein